MKFNRIVLVSILLIIFAIGAVSAADDNMTDTANEVLSAEPTEDLEVSQGDFTELSTLISNTSSGKKLTLERDYVNDESSAAITISKPITIDGQNHTIDANKLNVFIVENKNVVLKNINFINGGGNRSVVYGECTVESCSFTNCSHINRGGAMYGGTAYDCTFTDCSAGNRGGAIYWGDAHNCIFENCKSKMDGGAIWGGDAFDCTFVNCSDRNGVVIYYGSAYDSSGKLISKGEAYNCYFIDCPDNAISRSRAYNCTFINSSDKEKAIKSVTSKDVGLGKDAVIKVNLNKNVQGNLDVVLNGITKNVKITGETVNVRFSGLAMGNYNVTVYYPGNNRFPAQNMTSRFKVVKGTPIASGAVNPNPVGFGDDAIIKVNMLNSNINGNIWFTISDENKTKILTDKIHIEYGIATRAISGLGLGKYYLHLYYAGNTHYKTQTIKGNFEVAKKTPISSVNVSNWAPGEDVKIKVKMNGVNGNVWFTVSDANKTKILTGKIHIEDGYAIASIPNLKAGKYYLHIYYAGNVHYSAQTLKSSFEVTKISPELSAAKTTADNKTVLTANIAEDATGNVNFNIDGNTYKAKIVNGVATVTLPDMAPGTYTLKSSYGGNYKYLPETKTRTITIK